MPTCQQIEKQLAQAQQRLEQFLLKDYQKQSHITLYAAGFLQPEKQRADDVSERLLDQQEALIRTLDLPRLQLKTHALNSFQGAAFIEVMDDQQGSINTLHNTLSTHFGQDRDGQLTPHLTVGLYKNNYATEAVAEILCQQRLQPIAFECDSIHLLAYSSEDIRSPLISLRRIALG